MRRKGFTLIELLIVVAIIAILALIAVPNLLDAQVRAKVARVRSDFRTIATAIETYAIDCGDYPRNWIGGQQLLTPDLTTPVAYITSANLIDPFSKDMQSRSWHYYGYHRIMSWADAMRFPSGSPWRPDGTSIDPIGAPADAGAYGNPGALRRYGEWLVHSIGPDRVWSESPFSWPSHDTLYDPTNGTISFGNIVRTQRHPEGWMAEPNYSSNS